MLPWVRAEILSEREQAPITVALALRWTGVVILAAALFAGPLAFGAVTSWAWALLWVLAAVSFLLTLVVWAVEGRAAIVLAPSAAIAGLIAAAAAAQLVPLPSKLFYLAGDRTREIHNLLSYGARLWSVSLDGGGTVEALLKAAGVFMAAVSALALPRSRAMLFVLAGAVAVSATVASVAGIVQENGTSEKIYGIVDLTSGSEGTTLRSAALDPALSSGVARVEGVGVGGSVFFRTSSSIPDVFGPYADSNHFAGLVEIALPMLLGLFLALLAARGGGWGEEGGFIGSASGNLTLLVGFAILAGTAAVVYAHSFGGCGGVAVGLAASGAAFARTRRTMIALAITVITLAVVAAAAAFVLRPGILTILPDVIRAKFAGRWEIWGPAAYAVRDFPLTGSGLGSFAAVIPHYESTEAKHLFAHNDYLQLALEAGLPVAVAVLALGVLQVRALLAGARRSQDIYCAALCAGAFGSAAAIAFHSLFDFNLHVPANALALTVMTCVGSTAAGAVRVSSEAVGFTFSVIASGRGRIAAFGVVAAVLAAFGAVTLAGICRADHLEAGVRSAVANIGGIQPQEAAAKLRSARADAGKASKLAPWDGGLRYRAAMLAAALVPTESDPAGASRLREESLRDVVAAVKLSPAYTYYALTALTMGARDNAVTQKWPMASFDYKREIARALLDEGRGEDGLRWTKEALALASTARSELAGAMDALVADLVKRFGAYERMSKAAPDTFIGHLIFAKGLEAAGIRSAAVEEYLLAAQRAKAGAPSGGANQRSIAEAAQALAGYGKADAALDLYKTVLDAHGRWQYLRLEYARALAGAGRTQDARLQLENITSSNVPEWLRKDALSLRESIRTK